MREELNNSLPWYLCKAEIKYPEIHATAVVFLIPEIHSCQLLWKEIISLRDFQEFYLIEIAINSIPEHIKKRKEKKHHTIYKIFSEWLNSYIWMKDRLTRFMQESFGILPYIFFFLYKYTIFPKAFFQSLPPNSW